MARMLVLNSNDRFARSTREFDFLVVSSVSKAIWYARNARLPFWLI